MQRRCHIYPASCYRYEFTMTFSAAVRHRLAELSSSDCRVSVIDPRQLDWAVSRSFLTWLTIAGAACPGVGLSGLARDIIVRKRAAGKAADVFTVAWLASQCLGSCRLVSTLHSTISSASLSPLPWVPGLPLLSPGSSAGLQPPRALRLALTPRSLLSSIISHPSSLTGLNSPSSSSASLNSPRAR